MNKKISCNYGPFKLEGTVIEGDWEGDDTIPNGKHYLPPYIDELWIMVDGEDPKDTFTVNVFTEEFEDECREYLMENGESVHPESREDI